MTKKHKITLGKKRGQPGLLEASSWFLKNPHKVKLRLPRGVSQHLKVLGFLTIWFTIPFLLLLVLVAPPARIPEFFPGEPVETAIPSASPRSVNIYFKLRLAGVLRKNVANQPVFVRAVNQESEFYNFTFNPVSCWQDESRPELFRGKLSLSDFHLRSGYTLWVKGPVHLQRKFENITLIEGEELDLTSKELLSGDLILPGVGQDDVVNGSDRDYLWSLVAKDGKAPLNEEIRAGDLDLDGKITGRDYSLLIDTRIGVVGEK